MAEAFAGSYPSRDRPCSRSGRAAGPNLGAGGSIQWRWSEMGQHAGSIAAGRRSGESSECRGRSEASRNLDYLMKAASQTKGKPNPIDRHVGVRVRMRRMMLEMTQEALGDALGITFQQVQKYEKGVNRISASKLQRMCQILQVPVAFFFEGAPGGVGGTAESPSYVNDFLASADGVALTKAFTRIENVKLRRLIVGIVEDCAKL
jgi:transcriptional regulator with XRE-family HTH domain